MIPYMSLQCIYMFTQQISVECLFRARPYSGWWEITVPTPRPPKLTSVIEGETVIRRGTETMFEKEICLLEAI